MDSHVSTDSDGPSFVILDPASMMPGEEFQPSIPRAFADTTASIQSQFNLLVSQSHVNEMSTSQDQNQKLEFLIKENQELKETLSQNNILMKKQLDTLSLWQQDVFKTHQSHKEKFAETRDLILKLRAENASLTQQMETCSLNALSMNGDNCMQCRNLEKQCISLERSNKQFVAENSILVKERDTLREECSRLHVLQTQPVEMAKRLNYDASIPLAGLDISSNESRYNLLCSSIINNGAPREPVMLNSSHLDDSMRATRAEMEMLRKKYDALYEDYSQKSRECDESKESNMQMKSDVGLMVREIEKKECLLRTAIDELKGEREKITRLESERDEIGILKTQVEVYLADYKEERAAREQLAGEKEQMAESIRILEQKIREGGHEISNQARSSEPSNTEPTSSTEEPLEEDAQPKTYTCFKCDTSFNHLSQLQNHVESCLELA